LSIIIRCSKHCHEAPSNFSYKEAKLILIPSSSNL
jgi:hypothetical protein